MKNTLQNDKKGTTESNQLFVSLLAGLIKVVNIINNLNIWLLILYYKFRQSS